jgi:DNA polymerase-3 subunit beta
MKFVCMRDAIKKELNLVQKVTTKNSVTTFSHVLLEAKNDSLILKATDSRMRVVSEMPVQVLQPGSIAINADKLLAIVNTLPNEEIEFLVEDDKMNISPINNRGVLLSLRLQSTDGFPSYNSPESTQVFRLPQKTFLRMISHTIFAVSDDETRIFMTGVFLRKLDDKLVMVATDGRRLSTIHHSIQEGIIPDFGGVIISPIFLKLIKDSCCGEGEIALAIVDKTIYAEFDNIKFSCALIEGQFPNYERVIPETQIHQLDFDKNEFINALRRVAIFSHDKLQRVFLQFSDGFVTLSAEENQVGQASEKIPCDYSSDDLLMALNHTYVSEVLKMMSGDRFSFRFTDHNKAISLYPATEDDHLHVIMPMQLD